MLKQRLLTAFVLIALMLVTVYYLPPFGFALYLGLFIITATWEWTFLIGIQSAMARLIYTLIMGIAGIVLSQLLLSNINVIFPVIIVGSAWWLYAAYQVIQARSSNKKIFSSNFINIIAGYLILIPAWLVPVYFHIKGNGNQSLLLFLFTIVWMADSAAYFAGRAWGKTKLAPNISPGKSIEGLVGGLFSVMLLTLIISITVWDFAALQIVGAIAIVAVTTLFSVVGDLVESKYKRNAGVKDSGKIFPGHGGVLDRIDAFTAAAPIFAGCWLIMVGV